MNPDVIKLKQISDQVRLTLDELGARWLMLSHYLFAIGDDGFLEAVAGNVPLVEEARVILKSGSLDLVTRINELCSGIDEIRAKQKPSKLVQQGALFDDGKEDRDEEFEDVFDDPPTVWDNAKF